MHIQSKPTPEYHVVVGIIYKGEHGLITQRKAEGLLGGLWEFPGSKVKAGDTAKVACAREIQEEVNLCVESVEFLTRVRHAYTHFKIVVDVFQCCYQSGTVALHGPVDYRWPRIDETDQYPFPRVNHKFIPLLKKLLMLTP